MAIVAGENSYTTQTEVDTILLDFFDTDNWDNATTKDKEIAMKIATRNIDKLDYQGCKYDEGQELKFPRNYILYSFTDEEGEIPTNVKIAVAVEALAILNDKNVSNVDRENQKNGIKSQSIEGTSVSYSDEAVKYARESTFHSDDTENYLKYWIQRSFARR